MKGLRIVERQNIGTIERLKMENVRKVGRLRLIDEEQVSETGG
jgi:hypothetical protein